MSKISSQQVSQAANLAQAGQDQAGKGQQKVTEAKVRIEHDVVQLSQQAQKASEAGRPRPSASGSQIKLSATELDAQSRTADTFGVDKAIDAWPGLGVAEEGPIERPLLEPPKAKPKPEPKPEPKLKLKTELKLEPRPEPQQQVSQNKSPQVSTDKPDEPTERPAPEKPQKANTLMQAVRDSGGPATAKRSVSQLKAGAKQDQSDHKFSGTMNDAGGQLGGYLNTQA